MPGRYAGARHFHYLLASPRGERSQPALQSGVIYFPTPEEFAAPPSYVLGLPEFLSPERLVPKDGVLHVTYDLVLDIPPEGDGRLTPTFGWDDLPDYRGYYPPPSPTPPRRNSLIEPGMAGERLTLTGKVLTRNGAPVAGATLEFWQPDTSGQYDRTGYRMRGSQRTGADGVYRLETILPGYAAGIPHVSYLATAQVPSKEPIHLSAAVFFATAKELGRSVSRAARPLVRPNAPTYGDDPAFLDVSALPRVAGAIHATYDIVLDTP